ncbi:MAG TPA: 50S ribosomal protein L24, partial [Xanthobacteraceae bacterium]|nr:50S ribosomal protein L24 [Xanthobacteraceae bacterium]
MNKIRKGDTVVVLSGKDKGRQGTVKAIDGEKIGVENVNKAKKHQKPNPQRQIPAAIVEKEMPLHISKVAIWNV